jgi:hypothetical protein
MRQAQQQDMLRQMRPDFTQQQQLHMMRNMQNGPMMNMKQGNSLPRTAMANSQNKCDNTPPPSPATYMCPRV